LLPQVALRQLDGRSGRCGADPGSRLDYQRTGEADIRVGDVVRIGIEKLGQQQRFVAWEK